MGRESVDRGDLKLVNAALKELRYSFLVFEPYRRGAQGLDLRVGPHPGRRPRLRRRPATSGGRSPSGTGWSSPAPVPGSWRPASRAPAPTRPSASTSCCPFEQEATPLLAGDPKLINYRYFFTRKLTLHEGVVAPSPCCPGGFGTLDEAFELLTLMQTGRSADRPDRAARARGLAPTGRAGCASPRPSWPAGRSSPPRTSTWSRICHDHRRGRRRDLLASTPRYHSMRFVGRRLVLRLTTPGRRRRAAPSSTGEFADIVAGAPIERDRGLRRRDRRRRRARPPPHRLRLRPPQLRPAPPPRSTASTSGRPHRAARRSAQTIELEVVGLAQDRRRLLDGPAGPGEALLVDRELVATGVDRLAEPLRSPGRPAPRRSPRAAVGCRRTRLPWAHPGPPGATHAAG